MTASLTNSSNTPNGFQIDGYVYPQMIGYALRAPTTQDIYPPGTRWQDNSVSPAVQWYTTGAGIWNELPNSSFGVSSVTGTANQILATPTTGAVVLSLIGPYTPATYTAHGVLIGEGTSSIHATSAGTAGQVLTSGGAGADPDWSTATFPLTATAGSLIAATATNVIGQIPDVAAGQVLSSGGVGVIPAYTGSPSVTGTVTAGTGLIATTGNLTLSAAASGLVTVPTIVSGSAAGTVAGNGRIVSITFTGVNIGPNTSQAFTTSNTSITGSGTKLHLTWSGSTLGSALSIVSIVNSASQSVITMGNADGVDIVASTADITFTYFVLN